MRLTADLINNSLSYINPIKERELDLRALFDLRSNYQECIDFTDNDISVLGNFPLSPRLYSLLLARNRISSIQPSLHTQTPNLQNLVLVANRISELADLEPLGFLTKLTHLVLLENPVTSKENYRLYLISRLPTLRTLDHQRIRDTEREQASQKFGTRDSPTQEATEILSQRSSTSTSLPMTNGSSSRTTTTRTTASGGGKLRLTSKEKKRFEELLRNAKTLREIERLERDLAEGRIPAGVVVEGEIDED